MKSIFFGGGSWSSAFYIGIIKNLEEKYGDNLHEKFTFSGVSAGAIFAILCSLGYNSKQIKKLYKELAQSAIKKGVFFGKMSEYHDKLLDIVLTDGVYKTLEKRKCKIGVSRFFHKYIEYEKWENNNHLRKSLHASFRIPFYCRYQKELDNCISYDGGIAIKNLNSYDIIIGKGGFYDINMTPTINEIIFPPDNFNLEFQILEGYRKAKVFNFENVKKEKRIYFNNFNKFNYIFYLILIIEYISFFLKDLLGFNKSKV
tara:strand:+ start:1068 stop:1841 length:774 start_codon:yes stop_codon:yes gene_type:complete